jgi:hypothetical protein
MHAKQSYFSYSETAKEVPNFYGAWKFNLNNLELFPMLTPCLAEVHVTITSVWGYNIKVDFGFYILFSFYPVLHQMKYK